MGNGLQYQWKHMRYGKNKPNQPYTMKAGQERVIIVQVKTEKDLGVIFDDKLLFREHIAKKSAVANRNLELIFRSFTYLTKMFLCLYKSSQATFRVCNNCLVTYVQKRLSHPLKNSKESHQNGKFP